MEGFPSHWTLAQVATSLCTPREKVLGFYSGDTLWTPKRPWPNNLQLSNLRLLPGEILRRYQLNRYEMYVHGETPRGPYHERTRRGRYHDLLRSVTRWVALQLHPSLFLNHHLVCLTYVNEDWQLVNLTLAELQHFYDHVSQAYTRYPHNPDKDFSFLQNRSWIQCSVCHITNLGAVASDLLQDYPTHVFRPCGCSVCCLDTTSGLCPVCQTPGRAFEAGSSEIDPDWLENTYATYVT